MGGNVTIYRNKFGLVLFLSIFLFGFVYVFIILSLGLLHLIIRFIVSFYSCNYCALTALDCALLRTAHCTLYIPCIVLRLSLKLNLSQYIGLSAILRSETLLFKSLLR